MTAALATLLALLQREHKLPALPPAAIEPHSPRVDSADQFPASGYATCRTPSGKPESLFGIYCPCVTGTNMTGTNDDCCAGLQ